MSATRRLQRSQERAERKQFRKEQRLTQEQQIREEIARLEQERELRQLVAKQCLPEIRTQVFGDSVAHGMAHVVEIMAHRQEMRRLDEITKRLEQLRGQLRSGKPVLLLIEEDGSLSLCSEEQETSTSKLATIPPGWVTSSQFELGTGSTGPESPISMLPSTSISSTDS